MKLKWSVLAAGFTVLFLAGAGVLSWEILERRQLERESSTLVLETIQAVLPSWDPSTLLERAHPSLLERRTPEAIRGYFDNLRGHGQMVDALPMEGQVFFAPIFDSAHPVARYTLHASFERGRARIEAELIHDGERWWFTEFQIYSSVLAS